MDLEAKATRYAAEAVGKSMRVRLRKATRTQSGHVISGVITSCQFAGTRVRGCSRVAQWLVVINGEQHRVESLPR